MNWSFLVPSLPIVAVVCILALPAAAVATFMIYIAIRYAPIVARIFEEKPLFLPLRVSRVDGEDVRFLTRDGLSLAGTYLPTRSVKRAGVLVFCHEFLSNRWSALPYLDHLRDHGFDLFTFDFRNHGESDQDVRYSPLQWVTDHEVEDLRGAISYLGSRPDADPAGCGVFGVSRGGGTAICVAARDRAVWGVVTDGAFPTRGTMVSYIKRWAVIYVQAKWFWKILPTSVFEYMAWTGRMRTQFRLGCRYSNVEGAVVRLAPRPWLAIHGEKDAYIGIKIAEQFFARAGQPKELWVVPQAKHNRCRDKDPAGYANRLLEFYQHCAPRRLSQPQPQSPVFERDHPAELVPDAEILHPGITPIDLGVTLVR